MNGFDAKTTAISLLRRALWPVILHPGEKRPVGNAWGRTRPTEDDLERAFNATPEAGLGILVGSNGGVVDIEVDGPEGKQSLIRLFDGECVDTLSWSSRRGPHYVFQYDSRLAEIDSRGRSTFKVPEYPDLEFRFGGHGDRQAQSACPPTTTDGFNRCWLNTGDPAPLPQHVVDTLKRALTTSTPRTEASTATSYPSMPVVSGGMEERWYRAALQGEVDKVAFAKEGERHQVLFSASRTLGGHIHTGHISEAEIVAGLTDAARQCGLSDVETTPTIRDGLKNGKESPLQLPSEFRAYATATPLNASHHEVREWLPLRLGSLPEIPNFPFEVLPPDVQEFVGQAARAIGCDPGFVGGPVVAVGGGLIGRSANLLITPSYFASPIVFMAVAGAPGSGKTPALSFASEPASLIEIALLAEFQPIKARYKADLAESKKNKTPEPSKPFPTRAVVGNFTFEALYAALERGGERGLLAVADELRSILSGLNQYRGGKGNDRANLLSLFSGTPIRIDRVLNELGEPRVIPHPCVSIVGGIQPGVIHEMVAGGDDGLLDRWCFVYPAPRPSQRPSQRGSVDRIVSQRYGEIMESLYRLHMVAGDKGSQPHVIYRTDAGFAEFMRLADECADETNGVEFPDHLQGYWSKSQVMAGRFWLILTLLKHAANPVANPASLPMADAETARGAWSLVRYFQSNFRKIHATLEGRGLGNAPTGVKAILRYIQNRSLETFSKRDLTRDNPSLRDDANLHDALAWLKQKNAIREVTLEGGATKGPGRPKSATWEPHPDLRNAPQNSQNSQNAEDMRPHPDDFAIGEHREEGFANIANFAALKSSQNGGATREVIEL